MLGPSGLPPLLASKGPLWAWFSLPIRQHWSKSTLRVFQGGHYNWWQTLLSATVSKLWPLFTWLATPPSLRARHFMIWQVFITPQDQIPLTVSAVKSMLSGGINLAVLKDRGRWLGCVMSIEGQSTGSIVRPPAKNLIVLFFLLGTPVLNLCVIKQCFDLEVPYNF